MRHVGILFCAGIACVLAAHGKALAEEPAAGEVSGGRDLYVGHCAICHGLDGTGQGPLAQAMKVVPADLTQIAVKHAGEFPDAKVRDVIRNGGAVLGHGSTAMLPWGLYFSERRNPGVAKARIKALTEYIKSIQQGSAPGR
jgi:mono/diheme cytochrome c family protein